MGTAAFVASASTPAPEVVLDVIRRASMVARRWAGAGDVVESLLNGVDAQLGPTWPSVEPSFDQ